MHEFLQRWLSRRPKCPGLIASGLCFPDRPAFTQSYVAGASEPQLAALWEELAGALRQMPELGATTDRMCWTFSQRVLHAVARTDGAVLLLLAERSTDEQGRAGMERTLDDFRLLRVPSGSR